MVSAMTNSTPAGATQPGGKRILREEEVTVLQYRHATNAQLFSKLLVSEGYVLRSITGDQGDERHAYSYFLHPLDKRVLSSVHRDGGRVHPIKLLLSEAEEKMGDQWILFRRFDVKMWLILTEA